MTESSVYRMYSLHRDMGRSSTYLRALEPRSLVVVASVLVSEFADKIGMRLSMSLSIAREKSRVQR